MKVYGFDGRRKFLFGELNGGILTRKVDRDKHYLNIVGGHAIQADLFDKHTINKIIFDEGDRKLSIGLTDFLEHRGVWTKGFGRQYTISERYLTEEV